MDGYSTPVDFYLPGIFEADYFMFYNNLLYLYHNKPKYFYKNAMISAFYDAPLGAIWNGGRSGRHQQILFLNEAKKMLDNYGIPFRLTFTNSQIEERHLSNDFCNQLLKYFDNGNNEIIVASDILENYIRKEYKDDYKYILSTTKCLTSLEKINEVLEKYFLVVLDFRLNKNFNLLEKITNKDKCEILVNELCNYNCPHREECYKEISKMNLLGAGIYSDKELDIPLNNISHCMPKYFLTFNRMKENPMYISPHDINDKYIPMGFKHFKINGRGVPLTVLVKTVLNYLIKDEYKERIDEAFMVGDFSII